MDTSCGCLSFLQGCQRVGGLLLGTLRVHLDLLMHGKCSGAASAPGIISYAPFSDTSCQKLTSDGCL